MTTATLIARLLELPGEIAAAEDALFETECGLLNRKHCLKDAEARLLIAGEVPGKNAEERAAHLRFKVQDELGGLADSETRNGEAKLALSALQTELSCLRSVARLLSRETG